MLAVTLVAELEGVTELQPIDTLDAPFYYTFKVQCTSCREIHPNWVNVSRFESNEVHGSKADANFVWRCRGCNRSHTANVTAAPSSYNACSPPKRQNIIVLDCRGLDLIDFKADGNWSAKGAESGTSFTDIDLTPGEWFDYDEKAGEEVSIKEISWEVRRA